MLIMDRVPGTWKTPGRPICLYIEMPVEINVWHKRCRPISLWFVTWIIMKSRLFYFPTVISFDDPVITLLFNSI